MRMKKFILFFAGLIACYGMSQAQTITWAHLQWEASTTVSAGTDFEALGLVFADGITNAASPDGTAVEAQLGYGTTANPTNAAWTWTDAPFNGTWGQNFAYQVKTKAPAQPGTYYWSFRFKLAGTSNWLYAGIEGLWDATDHPCKTFTVVGGYTISWAHLQWEAATTVNAGSDFEAMGLAFAEGLTNASSKDYDAILAQIGYGIANNPTDAAWTWADAAFHSDWGDNFAYQQKITAPDTNGNYYYSFRFKINESYGEWVYAGVEGLWDATDHPLKTFTVVGGEEPAALSGVEAENNVSGIFDIFGRRLSATQKGINIINGTKIIIY